MTDAGEAARRDAARTAFCYLSGYRVTEVMNVTQPSASRGVTMSWVNYNLEIENPDDWPANTRPSFARTNGRGGVAPRRDGCARI